VTATESSPRDALSAPAATPSARERAINIDHVSKRFRLFHERASSLKEAVTYRRRGNQRYSEFWAVRDVSLQIHAGQTYGLIGHNGSGKSTLLRLIAGIHRPTSGKVTTHGRISALLELGAGFHPELSGRENIYLNGSILGLKRREINRVVDDIIEFAGIEQFIESPVKVYSSGMYVRLGFSIAVHVQPEILLIDEVIAVGDEEFQRRCFEHLYKLRREGVTIVLVSHMAPLMESMCDEIAWLDHGTLMATGKASDVVRMYLDKVNAQERDRLAGAVGEEGEEREGHLGSGEIRFEQLELFGLDGQPRATGATGEPLTLRLRYNASTPVVDPVFLLDFRHDSGVHIAGTDSRVASLPSGARFGAGSVDYVLERLPLMPGEWRVGVRIVDPYMQHTYDAVQEAAVLHVQRGSSDERRGFVDLGGRWHGSEAPPS
jgi:ABC-type polysaccharide/polyol phosphate transport system ATPase subunit